MYLYLRNEIDSILTSKFEIAFLLGSGATIAVPKFPTWKMITQKIKVCNQKWHDTTQKKDY